MTYDAPLSETLFNLLPLIMVGEIKHNLIAILSYYIALQISGMNWVITNSPSWKLYCSKG